MKLLLVLNDANEENLLDNAVLYIVLTRIFFYEESLPEAFFWMS